MMDELSKKRLDEIVVKNPVSLTEEEQAFLRAREPYLNFDQKVKFAKVLGLPNVPAGEQETPAEQSTQATVEKPKRTRKSTE